MATSEILGLFTSPDQYRASQEAAMQQQFAQRANLAPLQKASIFGQQAGYRLGQGIGGALGGTDPQLEMLSKRNTLLSQLDQNDPDSFMRVAQAAAQMGDPQFALAIAQEGRKAKSEMALTTQRTAEKMTNEQRNALAYASQFGTPDSQEFKDAYQKRFDELTVKPAKDEATTPEIKNARQLALLVAPEGTPEYNAEFNKQLNRLTTGKPAAQEEVFDLLDKLKALDPVKDKFEYDTLNARLAKLTKGKSIEETIGEGFGILGKALAAGQKKESEATGTFSAENFKNLGSAVAASTSSKRNIATLENALTNAFTGKFAEGKEAAVASLIALGFPVGDDLKKATSNTQLIQAMGTRYIFPLVKNYPGSLAAKELASLEKTAPNALQQPETIQRLVNLLKDDLAENEYTYNAAKTYKQQNKNSLIGFNDADAKIEFQNKLNTLKDLVDRVRRKKSKTQAEDAEIQRLRKELYIGG